MVPPWTVPSSAGAAMNLPFQFDPWHRLLEDVGVLGPILSLLILAGDALLTSVLHHELKRSLRLSSSLAWFYLVISAARCLAPRGDSEIDRLFKLLSAVALALAVAQTVFVLVVDFVLGRNGKSPARPMIRYGLLGVTFLVASLVGLRAGGVTTFGVLASGAVVVGGIGAAVAEVLRQVGAGILVQYARPFDVGDVVHVAAYDRRGRVMATSWRTTTLRSNDGVDHLVPNNEFVTRTVTNYGHGERMFRRDVDFDATYDAPPELVKQAVLEALRDVAGMEHDPPPTVIVSAFKDSGIAYQFRYWTRRSEDFELVDADVRARVWYAFARAGLAFPFPTRTLHLAPPRDATLDHEGRVRALQRCDLFTALSEEAIADIALHGHEHLYGAGEVVVRAGEPGRTMHIVLDGEVMVTAADDRRELFRLGPGQFFGEMSLVTGAARTATVITAGATRTFVLDEPSFRATLARHPEVAEALSDILAARQTELAAKLEAKSPDEDRRKETRNVMLERLKSLFGLKMDVARDAPRESSRDRDRPPDEPAK